MEIKQQLRLSQQLVMTPQLQQAIRLLQLSRLELIEEVRKELDNNPVLSDEEPGDAPRARTGDEQPIRSVSERPLEDPNSYSRTEDAKVTEKATREVDWEKFLENRTLQQPSTGGRAALDC